MILIIQQEIAVSLKRNLPVDQRLFPSNFFFRQYFYLINKTSNFQKEEITQNHHIYPISIFGKNSTTVQVSLHHHIVAHYLLYRGYQVALGDFAPETIKMGFAISQMSSNVSKSLPDSQKELKKRLHLMIENAKKAVKFHHTEESKQKNSLSHQGKITSEATRIKQSKALKGRPKSVAAKINMKIASKKKAANFSKETIEAFILHGKQWKESEEGKRVIQERAKARIGSKMPEDFVEKRQATIDARLENDPDFRAKYFGPKDEEFCKKRSEIQKALWANPEYRKMQSEAHKKANRKEIQGQNRI